MSDRKTIVVVSNSTEQFGEALPIGTIIKNTDTKEQWELTASAGSTDTLTTATKVSNLPAGGGGITSSTFVYGAPTNMATSTNVKLQFNNEQWDLNNEFDTTNYRFTAKENKKYEVSVLVKYIKKYDENYQTTLKIYKNGSNYMEKSEPIVENLASNGQLQSLAITAPVDLVVGDYIEIYGFSTTPSNLPLVYMTQPAGYLQITEIPTS